MRSVPSVCLSVLELMTAVTFKAQFYCAAGNAAQDIAIAILSVRRVYCDKTK